MLFIEQVEIIEIAEIIGTEETEEIAEIVDTEETEEIAKIGKLNYWIGWLCNGCPNNRKFRKVMNGESDDYEFKCTIIKHVQVVSDYEFKLPPGYEEADDRTSSKFIPRFKWLDIPQLRYKGYYQILDPEVERVYSLEKIKKIADGFTAKHVSISTKKRLIKKFNDYVNQFPAYEDELNEVLEKYKLMNLQYQARCGFY